MVEKIVANAVKQLRPEFDKENYDRVIELCNKIINYQTDHAIALFFRASSKLKKKDYEESESDFKELMARPELDKKLQLSCLRGLATLYDESEDFDKHFEIMCAIIDYKIQNNMSSKLFEEVDKISKKCVDKGQYQAAEMLLMKIVNCGNEVAIDQKQSAIINILTLNPYFIPSMDKAQLCQKGIELDPKWDGCETLLNILHDYVTDRLSTLIDKGEPDPKLLPYWTAMVESLRKVLEAKKSSEKISQYLLEYSIGFGNDIKEIVSTINNFLGDTYKTNQLGILIDYTKTRLENNSPIIPKEEFPKFPSFFLFHDLFIIDKNMQDLKYSDALAVTKHTTDKLLIMKNALNNYNKGIAEFITLLNDTLLLRLNRYKEVINNFEHHSKSFPNCKALYELYFEAATILEENFNVENYLDGVQAKFPDWSWVPNIRAWLIYSSPLTEEKLNLSIKLLEDSINKDTSLTNDARIRLGTLLWVHQGLLKQPMEVVFELWLKYAKGNPNSAHIFYCISLYLLIVKNDMQKAIKSLERSVSLQPDFSSAGELLYILYMANGNHNSAINLLEKVCNYNPICYYSFYYLGLEQIRVKKFDYAIDSIQNAIRLYYVAYGNQKKLMKSDCPELNKDLLISIFSKITNKTITKLHPSCNAAIMWLQLCHCYMEQANFEGAYNCANKALDDYLKYSLINPSSITIEGEFASLITSLIEINKPNYVSVPKYNSIQSLLTTKEDLNDLLSLLWNLAKTTLHLSLLKETLVYSELGLKVVSLLYSSYKEICLKYANEFVLYVMHCGHFLIERVKKSGLNSISPHVITYLTIVNATEETSLKELLQKNLMYSIYCVDIYMQYSDVTVDISTTIKKMIYYAEIIETLCKDKKELYGNIREIVLVYNKCYILTKNESYLTKAKSFAISLLQYFPDNSDYWLLLSSLYSNIENTRYTFILQALSLDPENESGWSTLAFHYYLCGDIKGCIKCLIELKGLNPLNEQLHLYQALIYYALWTESKNSLQLELAWGCIGEYLGNYNSTVLGWLLRGLLAIERKEYEDAYLYLQNVIEVCEKQNFNDWKWLEYKYIESTIKSGKYKELSVLLNRINTKFKYRDQIETIIKELNNEDSKNIITFEPCDTIESLKKLNSLLTMKFIKYNKLYKCSREVLNSIAKKFNSRASILFFYLQFKAGILYNDETHSNHCIELIANSSKCLIKGINLNKKSTQYLLKAELELSKGNKRNSERQLKLLYMLQPELMLLLPRLLKQENDESLERIKIEYLKYPNKKDLYVKLIILLIQSGTKQNILSGIKFLSNTTNEKLIQIKKIAQEIKETYEGNTKQFTDNDIGKLLKIYQVIATKTLSPTTELETEKLIRNYLTKSNTVLNSVTLLVKSVFLLHSFGYHSSVVSLATPILQVIDEIYTEEKDTRSELCKGLTRNSHILIAIASNSLLHNKCSSKAQELLNSFGFVIAEDSVPFNTLYLQSIRENIFHDNLAEIAFQILSRKQTNSEEKFFIEIYSIIQYLQLKDIGSFSSYVERIQQMLNSLNSRMHEVYENLPCYARALVNALHGIYMMKMMVFLQEEKESYIKEGKEADKIQKKMNECSKTALNRLKTAIEMYPEFEFTITLKKALTKIKAIH